MAKRVDEFLKRVPKGAPVRVSSTIETAFSIVETVREKVAAIFADGRLSREGKDESIRDVLSKGPAEHMNQLRSSIERDLGGIRSEREGMRRRVLEANAFSETRKSEVRAWLRGLGENERRQLVYSTKDPLIIESIVTVPHYLSALTGEQSESLTARIIENQNHARLAILAVEESAFEEAEAAIKVATADIRRESGMTVESEHAA